MRIDDKTVVTNDKDVKFWEELFGQRLSGGPLTVAHLREQAIEEGHTPEEIDLALEAMYAPEEETLPVIPPPIPERESLGRRILNYFTESLTTSRAALLATALLTVGTGYGAGAIHQQLKNRDARLTVSMFPHRTGKYTPPTYTHNGTFPGTDVYFRAEKRQDFMGGEALEVAAVDIPGNLSGYKEIVRNMIDAYFAENPDSEDRGKLFGLRSQVSDPDKFKLTRTSWRGCWGTQMFEIGDVLAVAYNQDCDLKWVRANVGGETVEFFDEEAAIYYEKPIGSFPVKDFSERNEVRSKLEDELKATMSWLRSVNRPDGADPEAYPLELCGI